MSPYFLLGMAIGIFGYKFELPFPVVILLTIVAAIICIKLGEEQK